MTMASTNSAKNAIAALDGSVSLKLETPFNLIHYVFFLVFWAELLYHFDFEGRGWT